ncbi:STY4851/ECs_5259 family protein [Vibrio parahaemolyticus]|uniref:STY4851/ECs_5259 family protein n=2 Tax=Vibrio parahaemolyticus TaxID=670 RepID=UPI001123BBE2|nr:STY4851/ECs_5259 family protein [Vibrio parahaemolyticus]ELA8128359.1 hypothetical protein [Vibrio parahaemolyticus]TOK61952.1 hypothetical protein CGI17_11085 [Vibrio parahaemolyticus]TOK84851.1 hypothetical protein CGI11_02180 [Vibrio parahaemolyticus]
MSNIIKPNIWISSLLARHGIERPDGRPLYKYSVTDAEFEELKGLLAFTGKFGIRNTLSVFQWDAAFVIYCAEWWRRNYGGHWGWEGIFSSLDIPMEHLNAQMRSNMIELGLHRWKRDIKVINGSRRMLGTVATEGGLPLNLIRESGSWLQRIAKSVINSHIKRSIPLERLLNSHKESMPQIYRSPTVLAVLEDVISTVVDLRNEFDLVAKDDPVNWLDKHQQDWRSYFPLPIESEQGRALLNALVSSASKAELTSGYSTAIELNRFITDVGSHSPTLTAELEIPQFLFPKSMSLNTREISQLEKLTRIELVCIDGDGKEYPWCRGMVTLYKGDKVFKLIGKSKLWYDQQAMEGYRVIVRAQGQIVSELPVVAGGALDLSEPWLFREEGNKAYLVGTASSSIKDKGGIVYIPDNFVLSNDERAKEVITPLCSLYSGRLWRISGQICLSVGEDSFVVETNSHDLRAVYQLVGKRCPYVSVPSELFIGLPKLRQYDLKSGDTRDVLSNTLRLLAKPVGKKAPWVPIQHVGEGFFEIKLLDSNNSTLMRKRVGILNPSFRLTLSPDSDSALKGVVELEGMNKAEVFVASGGPIILEQRCSDSGLFIGVEAKSERPPSSFAASFQFRGQTRTIDLQIPFPARGALLFDPSGNNLPASHSLYLQNLWGYRVKLFSERDDANQGNLVLELVDPDLDKSSQRAIYYSYPLKLDFGVCELHISDWREDIRTLLSVSKSVDAFVRITFELNHKISLVLTVRQYDSELTPDKTEETVSLDLTTVKRLSAEELEQLELVSLNLCQPEQNDRFLLPERSESVSNGTWLFQASKRKPGPWLVYPSCDNYIHCRPLLWTVPFLQENQCNVPDDMITLPQAVRVSEQEDREKALKNVLFNMTLDYDHKSWAYIDHLWERTEHLPMHAFDIWRVAVNSPSFLVSLIVRNRTDIVEKLTTELPVLWEAIPLNEWRHVFNNYASRLNTLIEDDPDMVREILAKRIDDVAKLASSMSSISQILKVELLGQSGQELASMKFSPEKFAKDVLLGDPELPGPIRDVLKKGGTWPQMLDEKIVPQIECLPEGVTSCLPENYAYQRSVLFLPAVLAWQVVKGVPVMEFESLEVFNINRTISFDEDCFSQAFNIFCAWFYYLNKGGN